MRIRRCLAVGLSVLIMGITLRGRVALAEDTDQVRAYLALRVGWLYFADSDSVPEAELENPAAEALGAAAVGVNLNKHWGIEIAGEGTESRMEGLDGSEVGEFALWTVLGQLRYRYPVMSDRLTPYGVLGGGVGFGEVNDKQRHSPVGFGRDTSVIGSAGIGLEYFVANNIAVGIESKYLYLFGTTIKVNGEPRGLNVDSLVTSLGLRLFFPEARSQR